jgi:hypothetical protein
MRVPTYRHVPTHGKTIGHDEVRFSNITSVVRSGYDPYLLAEELTEASFQFGFKSEDWQTVGFTLLAIS